MGRWWVFYADWQMECCGTPFSVGDEVSWPLLLGDADDVLGGGWSEELSEIAATVEPVSYEDGVIRMLRADDGLIVALPGDSGDPGELGELGKGGGNVDTGWDADAGGDVDEHGDGAGTGPGRRVGRTGLLTVERHGAQWSETTGTVRTIHVVHQDLAETVTGSRGWGPGTAARSLEAVHRSPKWFGEGRAGVLAELELPAPGT
ncbi:DUF6578 domain-containing protein [Streptomyces sp. NPDC002742]|uniref:DUF6578 domain-containing protein n=1 Tax=Streptomyces sp. NPDC002742 TaxID=3364663 RepID=UPI0036AA7B23